SWCRRRAAAPPPPGVWGGGPPPAGGAAAPAPHGRVPLPPYLRRPDEPVDRARYQTVYARTPGSVAAPTAGLHFTRELMEALEAGGVRIARVTLHVGVATFRPAGPSGGDPRGPGEERYRITREAAARVAAAE
ncbi:MAG: hypothetical protein F4X13_05335, partial [Gammaproteobacteria bacterium]|nr:hypothetical protein [Gammaproteobacteria bacterium]